MHSIASAIQSSNGETERRQLEMLHGIDQRRVKVMAKLDGGYDAIIAGVARVSG